MHLDAIEKWVRRVAGLGMLAFLAMVYQGLWRASRQPKGREAGRVTGLQREPFSPVMLATSAAALGALYALWRPIRLTLPTPARVTMLLAGAAMYASGLAAMLWGRRTLGEMYNISTSSGAQLYADHRLVTSGPFAIVRHPMYVGGALAELGALLIYRNWATLLIAANAPILTLRARREEEALAAEFGEEWAQYARRVPFWIPRLRRS